jgi:DNA-binding transcriptional ArsR family regulator
MNSLSTVSLGALARFGHALSDPTRTQILMRLREGPSYPADLALDLDVTRQSVSNHLACLRGCGLVAAVSEGRRTRYELADSRLSHALTDLERVVLTTDPEACADAANKECC